jgi:hypothetical protein
LEKTSGLDRQERYESAEWLKRYSFVGQREGKIYEQHRTNQDGFFALLSPNDSDRLPADGIV